MPLEYVLFIFLLCLNIYKKVDSIYSREASSVCSFYYDGQCEGLNKRNEQKKRLSRFFLSTLNSKTVFIRVGEETDDSRSMDHPDYDFEIRITAYTILFTSNSILMKQFLLLISFISTFWSIATAQRPEFVAMSESRGAKQLLSDITRMDRAITSKVNSPSTSSKAPLSNTDSSISSIEDILGLYEWNYYNGFDNPEYGGNQTQNIQIVKGEEENTVTLYDYQSYPITCEVNLEASELILKKQYAFETSDGFVFFTPMKWNASGSGYLEVDSIVAKISNEGISFDRYDILAIPSQESGFFYGPLFAWELSFSKLPTFKYIENEWDNITQVNFTDGWLNWNYTYDIKLVRNKKDPNLLCLINPYGEETPYKNDNKMAKNNGYILVDINDPDCVLVKQYTFSGYYDYQVKGAYLYNREATYVSQGMSIEKIKENYALAKKAISHIEDSTIYIPNCLHGFILDPVANYSWFNSITGEPKEKTAKIVLPANFERFIGAKSISLNKDVLKLECGSSEKLLATVLPDSASNKNITWISSDETVATVDNEGNVQAIDNGKCIISAIAHNDLQADCEVNVVTIPIAITFDVAEASLTIGESVTIGVAFEPANATEIALTWKSDNSNVAKVNNGKVTAVSVGTAQISAKTQNGLQATCEINVQPVLVESISITPAEIESEEGRKVKLSLEVLPENASNKSVDWTSSNTEVATVSNAGLLKIVGVGNADITATAVDGSNAAGICHVTGVAGIDEILTDGVRVDVYSSNGVMLLHEVGINEVKKLTPGLYILKSPNNTLVIRI